MSALWTAAEMPRAATGGRITGPHWQATGVSIDSRSRQPGDLFVALKGPSFDGHDFVAAALKRGAAPPLVRRHAAGTSRAACAAAGGAGHARRR